MNRLIKTVYWKILLLAPDIDRTTLKILVIGRLLGNKHATMTDESYHSLGKENLATNNLQHNSFDNRRDWDNNTRLSISRINPNVIVIRKSLLERGNNKSAKEQFKSKTSQQIIFKSISNKKSADSTSLINQPTDKDTNSANAYRSRFNSEVSYNEEDKLSIINSLAASRMAADYKNFKETTSKLSLNTQSNLNLNSELLIRKAPIINNKSNQITPNMSNMSAYQNIVSTNFDSNISLFNDNKTTNLPRLNNNSQSFRTDMISNINSTTINTNNNNSNKDSSLKSNNPSFDNTKKDELLSDKPDDGVDNDLIAKDNSNNNNQSFSNNLDNYFINNNLVNNTNNSNSKVYSNFPSENLNNNIYGFNLNPNIAMTEEIYKQLQNYHKHNNPSNRPQVEMIQQAQQKLFLDPNYQYHLTNNKDYENLATLQGYPLGLGAYPYQGMNICQIPGYNGMNAYPGLNYNFSQLKGLNINPMTSMPVGNAQLPLNTNTGYNLHNQNLYRNSFYEREKLQDDITIPKKYLYRDNYLDLLLESYDCLKNKDSLKQAIEEYEQEQRQEEELKKQSQNDSCYNNALDTEYLKSSRFLRKCENKICTVSERKKGSCKWHKVKINNMKKSLTICSLCYKAYKNKQFCYYCGQIYKDTYCNQDTKMWIECTGCKSWHHVSCEEQSGFYKDIANLAKDDTFEYVCFTCRESKDFKDRRRKGNNNTNGLTNKAEAKGLSSTLNSQEQKLLGRKIKNKASINNIAEANNRMVSRTTKKSTNEPLPSTSDGRDITQDIQKIQNIMRDYVPKNND